VSRIALAGESSELRDAIVASGHVIVGVDECEALVRVLVVGDAGCPPSQVPSIAMIARGVDLVKRGFDEADRSSLETIADAYVIGTRTIGDAIAWVTSEDRAERARGQPRLTVIGSLRGDDLGMSRPLAAEPMILGRAHNFSAEHPVRPDRMPTPTGSIARWHARARCLDGRVEVCDLGSTNGTLVIRHGEPARLLCPQQGQSGREFGPPAAPWLVRDPTPEYVSLRAGDHVQLPGFWRFRVDGDPTWQPD
jgi:hypothetical protein